MLQTYMYNLQVCTFKPLSLCFITLTRNVVLNDFELFVSCETGTGLGGQRAR